MQSCSIRWSFGRWALLALMAVGCLPPASLMAQKTVGAKAGETRSDNGPMVNLCWCPSGQFRMGSPNIEAGRGANENQVDVTLTRGFWMGKFEVTQAQYGFVTGKNPSAFQGASLPVEQVSWNDATAFCQKLTASGA